jgi:hypothetical protein
MFGVCKVEILNKEYTVQISYGENPNLYYLDTGENGVLSANTNTDKTMLICFMSKDDAKRFIEENNIEAEIKNTSEGVDYFYDTMIVLYEESTEDFKRNEIIEAMVEYAKKHFEYNEFSNENENLFKLTMDQIGSYAILDNTTIAGNLTQLIYGYTNIFEAIISEISATENQELIEKIHKTLGIFGVN